jgi:uncharacterized protein
MFVLNIDGALAGWLGMAGTVCILGPTCGQGMALEHTGDLYCCDHFVEPKHLLGNILKTPMIELVSSEKQRRFGQDKLDTLPRYCRECDVRFVCNGECPKNRFTETPDGEPGLNYLCEGYKAFFKHADPAMKVMANLLRQGRRVDEIMHMDSPQGTMHSAPVTKVGRNDPCPCGSGKKFKHCHGDAGVDSA